MWLEDSIKLLEQEVLQTQKFAQIARPSGTPMHCVHTVYMLRGCCMHICRHCVPTLYAQENYDLLRARGKKHQNTAHHCHRLFRRHPTLPR